MLKYIIENFTYNLNKLTSYIKENKLEAYRLYNNSDFDLPITVDLYKDNAVINVFNPVEEPFFTDLEKALFQLLKIESFFYKDRTKVGMKLPVSKSKQIVVNEYGHFFNINLSDYLDTGLFLDHRETRKWVAGLSKNKVVLNTFAYSGSFSIYAAKAGAEKTYSVDLSKTYCEWIKQNLALNNLPSEKNWVYKMDTLEFFNYAKRKNLLFDIIIIDPPTFSKNKSTSFSVQKDHPALINAALQVLSKDGFILFSNNYKDFKLKENALNKCIVKEKEDSVPPDFEGSVPHCCFVITKKSI